MSLPLVLAIALVIGNASCQREEDATLRIKGATERATALFEELLTEKGRTQSVRAAGSTRFITFGAEFEFDADVSLPDQRANELAINAAAYARVMHWMGLESDAFAACVAEFPQSAAFIRRVLDELEAQERGLRPPALAEQLGRVSFASRGLRQLRDEQGDLNAFEAWLEFSKGEEWGYPEVDSGKRLGRPLPQLNEDFLQSIFLGANDEQVISRAGEGQQPLTKALAQSFPFMEMCEAAKDASHWLPHPGNSETYFAQGSMQWEETNVDFAFAELHALPQDSLSKIESLVALIKDAHPLKLFRDHLWVVADESALRGETRQGVVGFLRLLQAFLLVHFLSEREAADVPSYLDRRWLSPMDDESFALAGSQSTPFATPKGVLRLLYNPFSAQAARQRQGFDALNGGILDFPHLALELRVGMGSEPIRRHAMAALTARLAYAAFGEFVVGGKAMPLVPSFHMTDAVRQVEEWRRISSELGIAEPSPELQPGLIHGLLHWSPHARPDDWPENAEVLNRAVFLPLWDWHQLPCFISVDELRTVHQGMHQWISEFYRAAAVATDEDLSPIWATYLRWINASGLLQVLQRCIAPGHPGRRVYPLGCEAP